MEQTKSRILIVDDSRELCEIMTELISMQPDMEVAGVAYDGKTALDMISKKEPDVVLLDIIMPCVNGITVLTQCGKNLKTKFIMLSALEINKGQNVYDLGAAYYNIKPFSFDVLIEKIRQLMLPCGGDCQ